MAKRTHSSIDRLPEDVRDVMTRMVTDGYWPDEVMPADPDVSGKGKPTYDDMVFYCQCAGHVVSRSAIARWGKKLLAYEKMNLSREIARQIMSGKADTETATETQKAAAEMMTAQIIDVITEGDLNAKSIAMISGAIRDCTQVALNADKYIRAQIKEKAAAADKAVTDIAKKKQIDPETLKMIREQIYGIVN